MSKLSRLPLRATLASAAALITAAHRRAAERRLDRQRADVECYGNWGLGHAAGRARWSVLGLAVVAGLALSSGHAWALGSPPIIVNIPGVGPGPVPVPLPNPPGTKHPFARSEHCFFGNTDTCQVTVDFARTNANQMIVIEDASGSCDIAEGRAVLEAEVGAMGGGDFLSIPNQFGALGTVSFGQFVHFSVIPDQTVFFFARASDQFGGVECTLNLTGEAIDQ